MKLLNQLFALFILVLITACSNNATVKESSSVEKVANIQHIEVNIDGMTCEIGCAKLIESKVYKLDGVTFSKVNFENRIGQFSYDSNKITKEEITKNINGIAGGELYTVTKNTNVSEFSEFKIIGKETIN